MKNKNIIDFIHKTFRVQLSSSWKSGNCGLVAEQDNVFPLSSTEGTNVRKFVVTDPSSEVLSPLFSILVLPFVHWIFAGGRDPLDWQTSSTRSPADIFIIGVIIRTSFGLTANVIKGLKKNCYFGLTSYRKSIERNDKNLMTQTYN